MFVYSQNTAKETTGAAAQKRNRPHTASQKKNKTSMTE
jgi:hypothetical protein